VIDFKKDLEFFTLLSTRRAFAVKSIFSDSPSISKGKKRKNRGKKID